MDFSAFVKAIITSFVGISPVCERYQTLWSISSLCDNFVRLDREKVTSRVPLFEPFFLTVILYFAIFLQEKMIPLKIFTMHLARLKWSILFNSTSCTVYFSSFSFQCGEKKRKDEGYTKFAEKNRH